MKSGMLAAEAAFEALKDYKEGQPVNLTKYPEMFQNSWVYEELKKVRNFHPSFQWGTIPGLIFAGIDTYLLRGNAPWTLHHSKPDNATLMLAKDAKPIDYPKPDGVLSFDLLTNLSRSGTNHNEDQPAHLQLINPKVAIDVNYKEFASPETRYCPAGVYEIVNQDTEPRLQINAQNCIHCKTCDIKDPLQNINWVPPEGGGGPSYSNM
jgi:electron-transferring-flavoprotein dehydrogenase